MKAKIGCFATDLGPFAGGFLNAILAEVTLARRKRGRYAFGPVGFGHCNERNAGRIASHSTALRRYARAHLGQRGIDFAQRGLRAYF